MQKVYKSGYRIVHMSEIKIIVDEMMKELAVFIFAQAQENLIKNGTPDTGYLMRSATVKKEGNNWVDDWDAPYAARIENGSGPHYVPPKVLEGWIRRKLGVKDPDEVKSIAFAISKHIERYGTKPQPFVWPAIETARLKFKGGKKLLK